MSDEEEDRPGLWSQTLDGAVEADADWPHTLLEYIGREYPLNKGTKLVISIESPGHEVLRGATHAVMPCGHRHIHLVCSTSASIASTNVTLIFAYAIALAYSEIDWQAPLPDWDLCRAWLVRIRELLRPLNMGLAAVFDDGAKRMLDAHRMHASMAKLVVDEDGETSPSFEEARNKKTIN